MMHFGPQAIPLRVRALTSVAFVLCLCVPMRAIGAEKISPKEQLPANLAATCSQISDGEKKTILVFQMDRQQRLMAPQPEWDERLKCDKNQPALGSYNLLEPLSSANLRKQMPDALGFIEDPSQIGACYYAFKAAQASYRAFHKAKMEYCNSMQEKMGEIQASIGNNKTQLEKWKELRDLTLTKREELKALSEKVPTYLAYVSESLGGVAAKYEADKRAISEAMNQPPAPTAAPAAGASASPTFCKENVKPQNGGLQDCNDYARALGIGGATGIVSLFNRTDYTLIQQESEAKTKMEGFGRNYHTIVGRMALDMQSFSSNMNTVIAGLEKSTGKNDNGFLSTATTGLGAAGPASSLLGGGRTPSAISGGSNLPAMATLAAAGASAAASSGISGSNWGSSGASASTSKSETAAKSEAAAKNGSPIESTPFSGDLGSGRGGNKNRALASNLELPGTSEPAKAVAEPGVFNPGGGSAGSSSRAPAAKAMPKSTGGANTGGGGSYDLGGAKGIEGMPGSFSTALDPKAAPKAPINVQGEVAGLLGQMKNLFNFDEGAPLDGGGGDSGAGAAGGGGGDGGTGSDSLASNEAGSGYGSEAGGSAEGAAAASGQADSVQGSPLGSVDKSLFARVRYRHIRCMEKGLVLYGLRERVE